MTASRGPGRPALGPRLVFQAADAAQAAQLDAEAQRLGVDRATALRLALAAWLRQSGAGEKG